MARRRLGKSPNARESGRRSRRERSVERVSSTAGRCRWPTRSGGTTTSPQPGPCWTAPARTCAAGNGTTSIASATPSSLTLKGHTEAMSFRVVQPGRVADRHRESGQDGEGVGREDRGRGPHPQGAHGQRDFRVVQPGRDADRHRRVGTGRRRCGTRRPGPRCSPSRGTPAPCASASFSADGTRIVTGEPGRDGEGVGREDRGRAPHPQGAHRTVCSPRRSARTGRGSSPGVDDRTAKVWDAKTGAELLTLKGHTSCV